jgi:two-component system, LytTR family, response regulator
VVLRTLLIDDDPPACELLRALIAEHGTVSVVGEVGTFTEARERLALDDYDLVLLDIQLRGGSGFDLLPDVRPGAKIIFVTAYDSHALRAFEVNAVDYLLKPVTRERLARSLARIAVLPVLAKAAPASALGAQDQLLLKLGTGSKQRVSRAQIRLVNSCENYTQVTVAEGVSFLVRKTLKSWAEHLPSARFVRVHRTAIVNLDHVVRLERGDGYVVLLHLDGVVRPVAVSNRYLADVRAALADGG